MSSRHKHWGARAKQTPSTRVDIADRVDLQASRSAVWARLADVDAVAQCLPGLVPGSLELLGGNRYRACLEQSALGFTARWELSATMDLSEPEHRLHVTLQGEDPKLGLTMSGTAAVSVESAAEFSMLDYEAHVQVEGSLAGMGGPVIRSVIADALNRFVTTASGGPEAATRRGRARRLLRRLRSWLRRGMPKRPPFPQG